MKHNVLMLHYLSRCSQLYRDTRSRFARSLKASSPPSRISQTCFRISGFSSPPLIYCISGSCPGRCDPAVATDNLVGIGIHNQICVVRHDNDLATISCGLKTINELYEDRLWIEVLFGLIDNQGPIVFGVDR